MRVIEYSLLFVQHHYVCVRVEMTLNKIILSVKKNILANKLACQIFFHQLSVWLWHQHTMFIRMGWQEKYFILPHKNRLSKWPIWITAPIWFQTNSVGYKPGWMLSIQTRVIQRCMAPPASVLEKQAVGQML